MSGLLDQPELLEVQKLFTQSTVRRCVLHGGADLAQRHRRLLLEDAQDAPLPLGQRAFWFILAPFGPCATSGSTAALKVTLTTPASSVNSGVAMP
jgi:hypothetical protein